MWTGRLFKRRSGCHSECGEIGPELNSRWAVDDRRTRDVGYFMGISDSEIYLGARPCLTF